MTNYTLHKSAANKAGAFTYQVTDNTTGQVVSKRYSKRHYVACTIDGSFYFGRTDLVGQGDHGKTNKHRAQQGLPPLEMAYIKSEENSLAEAIRNNGA